MSMKQTASLNDIIILRSFHFQFENYDQITIEVEMLMFSIERALKVSSVWRQNKIKSNVVDDSGMRSVWELIFWSSVKG